MTIPYAPVHITSYSPGTGPFVLNGPTSLLPTMPLTLDNGDTVFYIARDLSTNQWETGIGTLSGGQLSRTTVLNSSSGVGTAVNWAAGSREVMLSHVPAVIPQGPVGNAHTVAAGATTGAFTNTTYDGGTGASAYTVGDIVLALKTLGLLQA